MVVSIEFEEQEWALLAALLDHHMPDSVKELCKTLKLDTRAISEKIHEANNSAIELSGRGQHDARGN